MDDSKVFINTLLDSLSDIAILTDPEYKILGMNQAAIDLFEMDYPPGNLTDREPQSTGTGYKDVSALSGSGFRELASLDVISINNREYKHEKLAITDDMGTPWQLIVFKPNIDRETGDSGNSHNGHVAEIKTELLNKIEKKNSELEIEKHKLRMLFSNMSSAFAYHEVILDENNQVVDYRFLDCNRMFEEMTGLHKDDILGKRVTEVLPGTEKYWIDYYGEVALTGNSKKFINYSSALEKHFEVSSYSPEFGFFAVTFYDITDRIIAQEQLEKLNSELNQNLEQSKKLNHKLDDTLKQVAEKEKILEIIFNNAPSTMILLDNDFKIVRINEEGKRLTGRLDEDLLYNGPGELLNCINVSGGNSKCGTSARCPDCILRNTLEKTRQTGHSFHKIDARLKVIDEKGKSNVLDLLISSSEAEDQDDKYILLTIENISEEIEARRRLNESEEKFRRAFHTSPDAIAITTMDGKYIEVNEGFPGLTGYSAKEAIGKTSIQLGLYSVPEDRHKFIQVLQEMKEIRNQETSYLCKDGTIKNVQISARIFRLRDQPHILSITRDISERVEFIQALRAEKEKAEKADRLKSIFLANMSHEIRTPLNGILGFSDIIAKSRDLGEEDREKYLNIIRKSSDDLLRIVNDLLDISELENGSVEIYNEDIDLTSFLLNLFDVHSKKIENENKNITLRLLKPEAGIKIHTDETRLNQIFNNLLNNALKFTKDGEIEFGARQVSGNSIEFIVKDTGIGIAKENLELIFNRFRQEENTTNRTYGGNGLGLSIVKELLKIMQGDIRVESEPGRGTSFIFHLPYSPDYKEVELVDDETETDSFIQHSLRVLVVEDNQLNSLYLELILQEINADLEIVETGKAALDAFQKKEFDLILMDVRLPDMSGFDVTREIRKFNKAIPIIAQTAYAMESDRLESIKAGCSNYISKPLNGKVLLEMIEKLVECNSGIHQSA